MLAMLGWLSLLSTPLWPALYRETLPRQIGAIAIPALIAALYTGVILTHWAGHPGGFNSLDAVMLLFTDRWLVVAGWVHYLAFDLFIGSWELAESRRRGMPHLLLIPFLILTFFLRPYWISRLSGSSQPLPEAGYRRDRKEAINRVMTVGHT